MVLVIQSVYCTFYFSRLSGLACASWLSLFFITQRKVDGLQIREFKESRVKATANEGLTGPELT